MNNKKNIFEKKIFVIIFATLSAAAWGSAFPLIKIGMTSFNIGDTDTPSKTLFAGIRFLFAGLIVLLIAKMQKRKLGTLSKSNIILLILFSVVNTALHYFCFYIGLSNMAGSRSAILDSVGTFLLIILASICFKDEKMTLKKVIGCLLGFGGIVIVNVGNIGDLGGQITFMGDGMIMLSAICSAVGGILTRIVTKRCEPLLATGFSLALGGALLIFAGALTGGKITQWNIKGITVLVLLILVSSIGFSLYNQLICYNPVGEIAIFNSLIPILGVILSCIFLNEPFMLKYIVAAIIVTIGIYIINSKDKTHKKIVCNH